MVRSKIKEKEVSPRGNSLNLTKEQEVEIFKGLAHKTSLELANEYFPNAYNKDGAKRIAVHNIIKRIKKAPELYGISQDTIDLVQETIDARKFKNNPLQVFVKEREIREFKDKIEVIRDQAAELVGKKLERLNKGKNIDEIKLKEIADVLSMAIDKFRLVKGESTENVVHFSKMKLDDISAGDALQLVLKAREALIESKQK